MVRRSLCASPCRDPPPQDPSDPSVWLLGLDYFPDSAALFWPMVRKPFPNKPGLFFFDVRLDVQMPIVRAVFSLQDTACSIKFVSWARFLQDFPQPLASISPGVMLVQSGKEGRLATIAAQQGFWDLSKMTLEKIAKAELVEAPAGSSLVELCFEMIKTILKVGDEEAMTFLSKRYTTNEISRGFESIVFSVEDAYEVLHVDDHKELKNCAGRARTVAEARAAFKADFFKQAERVRATAKGKAKAKPKPQRPFPTTLSQQEAKRYLPPKSSLWKATAHRSWAGHCEGYQRVSAPWSLGEYQALKCVLRRLWAQHLEKHALPNSDCPWLHLLDEDTS